MEYYSSEGIFGKNGNGRIKVIRSKSGELMYLVEGREQAVLIDTCIGLRGLRGLVEELQY